MFHDLFAHALPGFTIHDIHQRDHTICVFATSQVTTALCPDCHTPSSRLHSRYQRRMKDLPWSGQTVQLFLVVHRFFCLKATCPRKTFAEPLPDLAPRFARRTTRLTTNLEQISLALGGEAGARLTCVLAFPTSAATLLRLLRRVPVSTRPDPCIIGIDDWAWRKGQRYGTIICDLQTHRPVDLLADRSVASTVDWLMRHPGIQIISRDRGGTYAEAARVGAPQAIQVADRWHLLANLGEWLEALLAHQFTTHRKALTQHLSSLPVPSAEEMKPRSFANASKETPGRQARLARYEQAVALAGQGMSARRIAHVVGSATSTIEQWLAAGHFPERKPAPARPARPTPDWLPYALERKQQGKSVLQIFHELQAQGYQGSYWSVYTYFSALRKAADALPHTTPMTFPSPRQARSLFLQHPDELTQTQQRAFQTLLAHDAVFQTIYDLVQRFTQMVRLRTAEPLQQWLEDVEQGPFTHLHRFARGIRQDQEAVVAGLSLPWSQGQTEGHITRLKLLKRHMYGRARLDLLRQRVLAAA